MDSVRNSSLGFRTRTNVDAKFFKRSSRIPYWQVEVHAPIGTVGWPDRQPAEVFNQYMLLTKDCLCLQWNVVDDSLRDRSRVGCTPEMVNARAHGQIKSQELSYPGLYSSGVALLELQYGENPAPDSHSIALCDDSTCGQQGKRVCHPKGRAVY